MSIRFLASLFYFPLYQYTCLKQFFFVVVVVVVVLWLVDLYFSFHLCTILLQKADLPCCVHSFIHSFIQE